MGDVIPNVLALMLTHLLVATQYAHYRASGTKMNRLSFEQASTGSQSSAFNVHASHYFARLMTPSEVAKATRRQPSEVQQKTEGHWVLCGDVSSSMFKRLKTATSQQLPARITGFTSPAGFAYFVLTHQVENYQHRFLLALTDPVVRAFLESMTNTGKLIFMLGDNDRNDSLLLKSPLLPNLFVPLLEMAPEVNFETQRAALAELPCIQAVMGNPLHVPSLLNGYDVHHVSVSLLLPAALNKQYVDAMFKASSV